MLKEYLQKRNISTYKLAADIQEPYSTINDIVNVKSKKYYLEFSYLDKKYDVELCKVNENSTYFIKEIAKYELEKWIERMKMEAYICNI